MGWSEEHLATWRYGQVTRGRAGPWRTLVPLRVDGDAHDAFPAGRER
jgi:hypothetical protein